MSGPSHEKNKDVGSLPEKKATLNRLIHDSFSVKVCSPTTKKVRINADDLAHHSLSADRALLHSELATIVKSITSHASEETNKRVQDLANAIGLTHFDDIGKNWRSQLVLAEYYLKIGKPFEFHTAHHKLERVLELGLADSHDKQTVRRELLEFRSKYQKHPIVNKLQNAIIFSSRDADGNTSAAPALTGGACAVVGGGIGLFGGPVAGITASGLAGIGLSVCGVGTSLAVRARNIDANRANSRDFSEVGANSWSLSDLTLESLSAAADVTGVAAAALKPVLYLSSFLGVLSQTKKLAVIGYASDLAGPAERFGSAAGPEALRELGLVEALGGKKRVVDLGNVTFSKLSPVEHFSELERKGRNFRQIFSAVSNLNSKVAEALKQGHFPVIIGGDHSQSLGSISAIANHLKSNVGIVWIDAHADINTFFTSISKNIHGMPLATLTGVDEAARAFASLQKTSPAVRTKNLVYIGLRNPDDAERILLAKLNISFFGPKEIESLGMNEVLKRASRIASDDRKLPAVVSFDLDSLDPSVAPGVSTDEKFGLSLQNGKYALAYLMNRIKVVAVEVVEYNPRFDDRERRTGKAAIELFHVIERNKR